MKKLALLFLTTLLIISCKNENTNELSMEITYPETKKVDTVDTYFDTKVNDPYRWLEDDRSEETAEWVQAQNKVTFGYLDKIPYRADLKNRLEKLWNYEKISAPFKEGDYTYFYKNDGLQNQSVVYRQKGDEEPEVFLDPNSFTEDGTTSLAGLTFSKNGNIAAYQISEGGSDWRKVIIMDAITKEIKEDTIIDVKFSGLSWKGNEGIFYSSYEKPKGSELSAKTDEHKLYFHLLGTAQKTDLVIFGDKEKRRYVGGSVSEDDRYLFISAANSTSGNELYLKDLNAPNSKIIPIVSNFDFDVDVENKSYVVFEDVEPTTLKDILYIAKLTEKLDKLELKFKALK